MAVQTSDQKRGNSGLDSSSSTLAARSGLARKARSSSTLGTRPIRSRLSRRRNSASSTRGAGRSDISSHFSARRESIVGAAGRAAAPPWVRTRATRRMLVLEIILLRLFLEPLDFGQDRLDLPLRRAAELQGRPRRLEVAVGPALEAVVGPGGELLLHRELDLEPAVSRGEDLPELLVLDLFSPHRDDLERAVF